MQQLKNLTMVRSNFCASISISHFFIIAPSTITLLGLTLSEKHDAFRNKRKLQDEIRAEKGKESPSGLQWSGTS